DAAGMRGDDALRHRLRRIEPRGSHILRKHAVGNIEHDDAIRLARLDDLKPRSELRAGEREEPERNPWREEPRPQPADRVGRAAQTLGDELPRKAIAHALARHEKDRRKRNRREQPEKARITKGQANPPGCAVTRVRGLGGEAWFPPHPNWSADASSAHLSVRAPLRLVMRSPSSTPSLPREAPRAAERCRTSTAGHTTPPPSRCAAR